MIKRQANFTSLHNRILFLEDVLVKNIDYRQQVIRDLLEKEQEFVSDLRSLFNEFLQPLHHADM